MSPHKSQVTCPVHLHALKSRNNVALITPGYSISFEELNTMILHCYSFLKKNDIKEGSLVGVFASSSTWYIALLFALFRAKAIAVPVNTRFPVEVVTEILASIQCSWLITSQTMEAFKHNEDFNTAFLEEISSGEFSMGNVSELNQDAPSLEYAQPATIIFSSGSTGTPKAVLHSWGNHWFNALGANTNIQLRPGDRWLLSLPLYHVAGIAILFRSFIAGSTVVIPDDQVPFEQNLLNQDITHTSLVATQLKRLLDSVDHQGDLEKLKAVLVGGGAIPEDLVKRALEQELPLFLTYGLSEMASQVTTTPANASLAAYKTSGKILPYREVKCAEDGEVLVRGEARFLGYQRKDVLSQPFEAGGWFRTGDLGEVDQDGFLTIKGRKDNMFISGGGEHLS